MTSDEFFAQNEGSFDVVFIDGLHEYAQVRADAINALAVLSERGYIALFMICCHLIGSSSTCRGCRPVGQVIA